MPRHKPQVARQDLDASLLLLLPCDREAFLVQHPRRRVGALAAREISEVVERHPDARGVPECPREPQRLVQVRPRLVVVPLVHRHESLQRAHSRDAPFVAGRLERGPARRGKPRGAPVVAHREGQGSAGVERFAPGAGRSPRIALERPLHPSDAFGEVAARVPDPVQRAREPRRPSVSGSSSDHGSAARRVPISASNVRGDEGWPGATRDKPGGPARVPNACRRRSRRGAGDETHPAARS